MLSLFPEPFPDELLYSICARFWRRLRYPNGRRVSHRLAGTLHSLSVVDLPTRLGHLADSIPDPSLTADRLIQRHTLFPLYAPFQTPTQRQLLRRDMLANGGPRIHFRAGIMAGRVRPPSYLRYCPRCDRVNMQQHGELYWQRLHQVPGVEVCPLHRCWLQFSSVRRRDRFHRYSFVPASQNGRHSAAQGIDDRDPAHLTLLQIAREAQWLLSQEDVDLCPSTTGDFHRTRLDELGMISPGGSIRQAELHAQFIGRYGLSTLARLQSRLSSSSSETWLARLVRRPSSIQPPIRYLLMAHFLRVSLRTVATSPSLYRPSLTKLPCVNPLCGFHRINVIDSCSRRRSHRHLICAWCGLSYLRRSADYPQLQSVRIVARGHIWERHLRILWGQSKVSLREMSRRLFADPLTLKRHASRAGLRFPRIASRVTAPLKHTQPARVISRWSKSDQRRKWLAALRCEGTTTKARRRLPATYAWLYRNDRQWLWTRRRAIETPKERKESVLWEERDRFLNEVIGVVAEGLKRNQRGRVTKGLIAKALFSSAWIYKHPDKLPLTMKSLAIQSESREEHAIRRILEVQRRHGARLFVQPLWRLYRIAGLRPDMVASERVQSAIERIAASL